MGSHPNHHHSETLGSTLHNYHFAHLQSSLANSPPDESSNLTSDLVFIATMSIPRPNGPDIDIGRSRGLQACVPVTDANENRSAYAGIMLDIVLRRTPCGNSKNLYATPDYSGVWARGLFYDVLNSKRFSLCMDKA